MKEEKAKQEKAGDIVCWTIIICAAIYFSVRIVMGVASKFYLLFPN